MAAFGDYMSEGVGAMSDARKSYRSLWEDELKQGAIDYALAQQANANEVSMWKMQQEYNTPLAQMERLKAAGLNPNLAYQMANSGNASSAPGVHQPTAPDIVKGKSARVANAMEIISGMSNMMQQIFGVIGGAQELDARRMANEQARMQLDVDRKLFKSVGSPIDLGSGQYGFEARFMPKASKLGLDYTLMPYRVDALDSSTRYRNYYTNTLLPLMRDLTKGRITGNSFANTLLEYQANFMKGMSTWERNLWLRLNYGINAANGVRNLFK